MIEDGLTRIKIDAHFDSSANNPLNPDPTKIVRWGAASETEMMDGWIEYVDANPEPVRPFVSQKQ